MAETQALISRSQLELAWSIAVSKLRLERLIKPRSKHQDYLQNTGPTALQVPDILLIIFQYLNPRALKRLARVCRLWSYIVPDITWRDLPTAAPLLKLYGLQFSEPRLRRGHNTGKWDFGIFGPHAPTKRQQVYLPCVRSLVVDRYLPHGMLRMHTLRKLSGVGFHLPNLVTLHFDCRVDSDDDFLGAIPFIMTTLKSLTLPRLPKIPEGGLPTFRQFLDSVYNTPSLSLEYLDASGVILTDPAAIEALGRLVQQQTRLRYLGIQLSNTESFVSAFNESGEYPSLSSLKICHSKGVLLPISNLDFIRPLFRFGGLKTFELRNRLTSVRVEKDVIAMASAWLSLQTLRLLDVGATPALLVSIAQ